MRVLLCEPNDFQVKYQINPWMRVGSVDSSLALAQWRHLKKKYEDLGVEVEVISQNEQLPDMVFAADQGLKIGEQEILLSRFAKAEREGESRLYKQWFESKGLQLVELSDEAHFEGGGECQKLGDTLLVGTGFRTNKAGVEALGKLLGNPVVKLELKDPRFYHLDTCLFVLNEETIFYYPEAFSTKAKEELHSLDTDLVELTDEQALHFSANSVVVRKNVLMQMGNETLAQEVSKRGYMPIMVDVSEFIKAGGGIHCLTFWLEE